MKKMWVTGVSQAPSTPRGALSLSLQGGEYLACSIWYSDDTHSARTHIERTHIARTLTHSDAHTNGDVHWQVRIQCLYYPHNMNI